MDAERDRLRKVQGTTPSYSRTDGQTLWNPGGGSKSSISFWRRSPGGARSDRSSPCCSGAPSPPLRRGQASIICYYVVGDGVAYVTQQRGILATHWLALLRSRGRPSHSHKARRKCSALPAHPLLRRGYPTERGGPPPLLGLSPGLCGPGRTVAYLMHRTVTCSDITGVDVRRARFKVRYECGMRNSECGIYRSPRSNVQCSKSEVQGGTYMC